MTNNNNLQPYTTHTKHTHKRCTLTPKRHITIIMQQDDTESPPNQTPSTTTTPATTTLSTPSAPSATTSPPPSFLALLDQACDAANRARADGTLLMEIEFPPVPLSKLDDSSISAYDLLSANLQLASEFAKRILPDLGGSLAITLPDTSERVRAAEMMGSYEPREGVKLWALEGGDAEPKAFGFLDSVFKRSESAVVAAPWASAYLVLGASCQELPALRRLAELQPDVPIICFNLKLDTLRGDLGLPAFPPKSLQHEFLCKIKPVYYMRPRSYSLSLSRPPFLLSYSGVLFRCYPEGYQTLLDRGKGSYRQVLVQEDRPALGAFKSELTKALKIDDEDASASAISQTGFKQATWWEEDVEKLDQSADWRL